MPATKRHTQALGSVFSCLFRSEDPLTKQELAQLAGVSLPTVNLALSELDEMGLLALGPERESTGGRRAVTYAITRTNIAFIGISVTGHSMRAIACNLYGEELGDPAPRRSVDSIETVADLSSAIADAACELAKALEQDGVRVAGVGVAVPSAINPSDGRLLNTRVLHLSDEDVFADALVEGVPYPTGVFNDANCGALAQHFPKADGTSYAYLSLERGVGGAIVIDGIPYEGPRGTAAEFGHICIKPGGKRCACGKAGCLEAYCSSNVLSKELHCTLDEFFERVEQRDAQAETILNEYIDNLTQGIQAIRASLGSEIVLGGVLASHLAPYFDKIREQAQAHDPFFDGSPVVKMARGPHTSVLKGAADAMALRFVKEMA